MHLCFRFVSICLVVSWLWSPRAAQAAPQASAPLSCVRVEGDALLRGVRARYRGQSLRANFTQTYTDAVMGARPTERGHLLIDVAGRMRFAYEAPEKKVFVYDGHSASFEETMAKQVTVLDHFEHSQAATALRLLTGGLGDANIFVRTANAAATAPGQGRLSFLPAAGQEGFARAEIDIARAQCEICAVRVIDGLGNVSAYALTSRTLGGAVPADAFVRQVPPGFDVLHVDVGATPTP